MRVFISADIEGVTTSTRWEETDSNNAAYRLHAEQMTKEVLAACEGAIAAGATYIVVKDAHGGGYNIDPTRLPKEVVLIRGNWGHPDSMVSGIDGSFDAAMFVGYHGAALRSGNPMSHTISGRHTGIFINDRRASEFMLFSLAAARYGVPTVFLAGDKMLCEDYADLHPKLITVAVKDGIGGATFNRSVEATIPEIRAQSEKALRQDLTTAKITLPEKFEVKITYKEHVTAERSSHYPGVTKLDDVTVAFSHTDYFEILRTIRWII
ncbi:MAG: M55 family metallopeptidase [Symbiobacteriaceae bacterium]|nr:M55 family metallopeptidase [Symbiobacteriaceae bacterium]